MTIYAINQTMIQRYLSVPHAHVAKKAIWLSGVAITVILSVVAYAGLVIYRMYESCDPVSVGLVRSKDQLLPLFTLHLTAAGHLKTGFPGEKSVLQTFLLKKQNDEIFIFYFIFFYQFCGQS